MTRSARAPSSRASSLDLSAAARAGTLLPATASRRSRVTVSADMPRLEQIRRVGCHLLYQYGYAGMTMRQIAAHLKIKAASLYYHFPSKQDILFDLMYDTASELMEGLLRIVDPDHDSAVDVQAQLDSAIRWHVLFHTQKREEAFVSHSELRSLTRENLESILTVRQDYDRLFDYILRRCQAAGVLPKRDTSVLRNAILTMCTATAGWFNPEGKFTAEQVADQICDFVWHGLLAAPGAAARSGRAREGMDEMADWHRDALREHPLQVPEFKPSPILELLTKLKNAKIRQIQKQKANPPE
ncbi:MAG: TetR/AcrR family transcriptional regulator [Acidobacteria bacterium]|nr:TetR/AcrR family transcriptional regulator [Acidobacteriota bacterium]